MYGGMSRLQVSFIKVSQTSVNENRKNIRLDLSMKYCFMLHLDNFMFTSL